MLFCGMSCNFGKNARSVSSSKRLKRRRENLSNRRRANIAHPTGQNPPPNAPPIAQTTLSMPKPAFSKLVAWIDGMHGFLANSVRHALADALLECHYNYYVGIGRVITYSV